VKPRVHKVSDVGQMLLTSGHRRLDPAAPPLPEFRELRVIRMPTWPAKPGSAPLRRKLAKVLDWYAAILRSFAADASDLAFELEGQPIVEDVLRSDWTVDFEKREVRQAGFPWASPDLVRTFANYCEAHPGFLDKLSSPMRSAVQVELTRRGVMPQ
jgi:hypothetical protein